MKKSIINQFTFFCSILILLSSCNGQVKNTETIAEPYKLQQTIYYNGDIITMEGDKPEYVEAVVQREGKIVFTGSKDEAFKWLDLAYEQKDGSTLEILNYPETENLWGDPRWNAFLDKLGLPEDHGFHRD
jgi:hypothetical protein